MVNLLCRYCKARGNCTMLRPQALCQSATREKSTSYRSVPVREARSIVVARRRRGATGAQAPEIARLAVLSRSDTRSPMLRQGAAEKN